MKIKRPQIILEGIQIAKLRRNGAKRSDRLERFVKWIL